MPRSRSRERRRSRDKRSRSRDFKRRERSRSREKDRKRERPETSRHERRDRSTERYQPSRKREKSVERSRKRESSREHRRDRSTSRSKKHRRSSSLDKPRHRRSVSSEKNPKHRPSTSNSGAHSTIKPEHIQLPTDDSASSTDPLAVKKFDPRKTFEIANEFSIEGFEQFTREHGIDFTNIETEDDRVNVHEKMEELLKAHFASQGKIYPPPKIEKPAINAATGFANDGSFMEQFKRMQDEYKQQQEADKKRRAAEERLKSLPIRRRAGGKILKTGVVAKTKLNEDGSEVPAAADPWSQYLKEVQKYKKSSCDTDSKTRPLVK